MNFGGFWRSAGLQTRNIGGDSIVPLKGGPFFTFRGTVFLRLNISVNIGSLEAGAVPKSSGMNPPPDSILKSHIRRINLPLFQANYHFSRFRAKKREKKMDVSISPK